MKIDEIQQLRKNHKWRMQMMNNAIELKHLEGIDTALNLLESFLQRDEGCEYCNTLKDITDYDIDSVANIEQMIITHNEENENDWGLYIKALVMASGGQE